MDAHGDSLARAELLFAAGRFETALELLLAVPDSGQTEPAVRIALELAILRGFLGWASSVDDRTLQLRLFFKARTHYYTAVYVDPLCREAYRLQAEFWNLMGRPDCARHLLQSIERIAPDENTAAAIRKLPGEAPEAPVQQAPLAAPGAMRLLVLVMPDYDPGLDIYMDGLRTVLGEANVVEYPWKPRLHGEDAAGADYYPLVFEHGGDPWSLDRVCAGLEAGSFDAILFGDMLERIPQPDVSRIVAAAGTLPFFLVDGWDDASNNAPLLLQRMAGAKVLGYFKREYIAGINYDTPWEGATVPAIPFPLSFADGHVPQHAVAQVRSNVLFWAGARYYGQRRLYLEALEEGLGVPLKATYSQEAYRKAFLTAHIGLSFCGFGFDTLRYYEIPAYGAVPLAERPPIVIPHDFRQGEHGMYFRDLQELEAQLAWLLQHPEALPAMAHAAHEHFLEYHVGSARARQLLGHMHRLMTESGTAN